MAGFGYLLQRLFLNRTLGEDPLRPLLVTFGPPEPVIFRLTDITHLDSQLTLTWETEPGYGYKVERSTDLKAWLQGSATRATNQVTLPAGASPEFFRVVRSP